MQRLRWRFPIAVLLAWLASAPGAPAQTAAAFFEDAALHEIRLEMKPTDWTALKVDYLSNTYYPANFKWRDQLVEDIGIRSRGTGSRSPIKPSLRVDFDRFEESQKFLGLKSVVLRANTQDPSMLHERLSMLVMRRLGVPASRESGTTLYVNDEFIGLYSIVESVDKVFLERNLGEDGGYLYKYDYNAGDSAYYFGYRGDNPALYSPSPFKPETHEKDPDPKPIEAMIRTMNQTADADFRRVMADYLDLTGFLKHVAVERYLAEQDGVIGAFGMNNYYIYRFEKKNLFQLIAWDKSNTFEAGPTESIWRFVTDVPAAQQNVLMRRLLGFPELRNAYLEYLAACARVAGGAGGLLAREVDRLYDQTRATALADPNKQCQDPATGLLRACSNAEFEADIVNLRHFAAHRKEAVLGQAAAELTPVTQRAFAIPDKGGFAMSTVGSAASTSVGYARIQPGSGATAPAGVAILGFRQKGTLVSETAVPSSPLLGDGRIYAEVRGPVNTGVALANPNAQAAQVTFYFTDADGKDFGTGTTTIPPSGQIAEFLDQGRFKSGPDIFGTFTFKSDVPISAVALRGLSNERADLLLTTLPVTPLGPSQGQAIAFPHFADGAGWSTQVVLVNPTDDLLAGAVQFLGQGGAAAAATPVTVTVDGQSASSFPYAIPGRSARRFQTSGAGAALVSGSVRVVPTAGARSPSGLAIFAYRSGGITVSEAGVPASRALQAARMYAEVSGESIDSGVAIANPSPVAATATLELTGLDGKALGLKTQVAIPGDGQVAMFLDQVPGLESLPLPFQGIVRISTAAPSGLAVVGLRSSVNERGDFLITTTPPVDEQAAPAAADQFFPHLVDSGGYTTQFILFSGAAGQAPSGTLRFLSQAGGALNVLLW
jgi:hypothetical protein